MPKPYQRSTMTFLNRKQIKPILEALERQWGFEDPLEYVFVKSVKNNIYICHRDLINVYIDDLRINNIGIYFGEVQKHGDLRLSIEGSQLIGPYATKNVLDLTDTEADLWIKGYEISKPTHLAGFVIVKHKNDYMGCGYVINGGEKILNYVPKVRRVHATISPVHGDSDLNEDIIDTNSEKVNLESDT